MGDTVWYLGPSICYSAPATYLVGYDNASLKTTIAGINSVKITEASSNAFAATVEIPANTTHAAVRAGAEVDLRVNINNNYVSLGKYNVDAILPSMSLDGKRKTMALRSLACKKLMHWQSDAPYDYWSQTKLQTTPSNMEEVIRITGKWSKDGTSGDLYLEDIAEDGFLYLTPKETRNGLIKAKFRQVSADAPIKFGVGLNYYVESKADAAARLGIDTHEVKDNMLQNNGIFAIYGYHDISGTDTLGIGVCQVDGTGFHLLSDAGSNLLFYEVDFGLDYYWMQMRFEEGRIKVWYRADASSSWTLAVDDVPVYYGDNFPWTYDEMGRGL